MLKELTKFEVYLIVVELKKLLTKNLKYNSHAIFDEIKYCIDRFEGLAKDEWGSGWFEEMKSFMQKFEEK